LVPRAHPGQQEDLISKAEAEYMVFEMADRKRPQPDELYSGENDDQVCFEFYMDKMERSLDSIPGITDSMKLKEDWFSGEALRIVQSKKNNDIFIDAATTLENIKASLIWFFSSRQESIEQSLEKLMEGEPIAKDNFCNIRSLIINLQEKYVVARRMGEAGVFSLESTYIKLMWAKLPHLIREWIREFGD
jgi:hypothetical protein